MASQTQKLHFILFPLMAHGHMIPMIDIAKLLAQQGVIVTIVTTPLNANQFTTVIARAQQSGLQIKVLQLRFPCLEARLPEGCENLDKVPSPDMAQKFYVATSMLQPPLEQLFGELKPNPNCIISDQFLPWTSDVAQKFHIPRLVFHGTCCFSLFLSHNIRTHMVCDEYKALEESEYFVMPGLPDQIEQTKAQLPVSANPSIWSLNKIREKIREAEKSTYGTVANTFEELESAYVKEYQKVKGNKVWCIGPVSLCNEDKLDKAKRVLRIGVSVGVEVPIRWGEEEKVGVLVHKDNAVKAIGKLMDGGEEGEERRKRARQLGEMAKRAMEGGSSHLNMAMLIQDIMEKATSRQ
ncbi:hypothetical protein ACSBR2_035201 [Camellia fascicularis]